MYTTGSTGPPGRGGRVPSALSPSQNLSGSTSPRPTRGGWAARCPTPGSRPGLATGSPGGPPFVSDPGGLSCRAAASGPRPHCSRAARPHPGLGQPCVDSGRRRLRGAGTPGRASSPENTSRLSPPPPLPGQRPPRGHGVRGPEQLGRVRSAAPPPAPAASRAWGTFPLLPRTLAGQGETQ